MLGKKLAIWGFELEEPVNFWTEASLFSAAGYDTFVYGPGDIAQAHTADEFVEVASLVEVGRHYVKVLETL